MSWTLAGEGTTASGRPSVETTTWYLVPDLPRSVGFGPVNSPPRLVRTEQLLTTTSQAAASGPERAIRTRTAWTRAEQRRCVALLHGWARCRRPRPRFRLDRPPCPTITTALMLRAVFRLALRQTEGLLASILHLLGLDLPVPDHSTLARRARTVTLASLPRSAGGPLHLLVDSTGLKLWGAGRMADREARHQKAALLAGAAHRPGRRERPDCRGHADGPRC